MGATKTHIFTEREIKISEYAKALAHPARIAILDYLLKHKTCICKDLTDELPLSQSTISQHLKELKRVGIIQGEIVPPKVCYCINPSIWEEARQTFAGFLQKAENCC